MHKSSISTITIDTDLPVPIKADVLSVVGVRGRRSGAMVSVGVVIALVGHVT